MNYDERLPTSLHLNSTFELSTDSTEALVVDAELSSNTPTVQLPSRIVYRKSKDGKGIKNTSTSKKTTSEDGPYNVKPSSTGKVTANRAMSKIGVVSPGLDTDEVLPPVHPTSVTSSSPRSISADVTTVPVSRTTCNGTSIIRTVTSSTTKVLSTMPSSGNRSANSDRVKSSYHHASSRSEAESPHPLNTNFKIPMIPRENKCSNKRPRHEPSSHRYPKYTRTNNFTPARRGFWERNPNYVRDYRPSSYYKQEMRHGYRRR